MTLSALLLVVSAVPSVGSPISPPNPACAETPARSGYTTTYDSQRRMVVVFGGETATGGLSGALLGWNGTEWTCLAPSGPAPRSDATLIYDERRRTLVLYGGRAGRETFRDTWEYNGSAWTLVNADGPSREPHGVGAYDPATGAALLFNGTGDEPPVRRTWKLAAGQWTSVSELPQGEFPDAMMAGSALHPARLLTARRTETRGAYSAQLYDWRSNAWAAVATTGPTPTFSPQAPAARTTSGALLYAGFEVDRSVTTWILDGTAWRKYDGQSPPRRKGAQMVFDAARGVVVLHSGDDGDRVLDDTWEWNGTAWRKVR